MMSLGIRKIIVLSLIGMVFLAGNILVVANWFIERGVEEKANWVRQEFSFVKGPPTEDER